MKPSKESPKGLDERKNLIVGTISLLIILLIGYFLFKEEPKAEIELESEILWVQENSIKAHNIPYFHKTQVLGVLHYQEEVMKYDWDWEIALKIMQCESSFNPKAVGDKNTPHHSFGLMQVRNLPERNLNVEDLLDPIKNIEIAYEIYKSQNWQAWKNCYKSL